MTSFLQALFSLTANNLYIYNNLHKFLNLITLSILINLFAPQHLMLLSLKICKCSSLLHLKSKVSIHPKTSNLGVFFIHKKQILCHRIQLNFVKSSMSTILSYFCQTIILLVLIKRSLSLH